MAHIFCSEEEYRDVEQVDAEHTDVVVIEPVEGVGGFSRRARSGYMVCPDLSQSD